MAQCSAKRRKIRRACLGEMRYRIDVYTRRITPPGAQSVDFLETLGDAVPLPAIIDTIAPVSTRDGTQRLPNSSTHAMTVRFIPGLTIDTETIIGYNGKYFAVKDTENLDERNQFLVIYCEERGRTTAPVNFV